MIGSSERAHNFVDHTGRIYNKIEAVRFSGRAGLGTVWTFKCHCGNQFDNYISLVKRGMVKSCGCIRKNKRSHNSKKWEGMRFNYLVAVSPIVSRERKKRSIWLFRCDCGAQVEKLLSNVVHGGTKSCGCMKSELIRKNRTVADNATVFRNAYNCHLDCAQRRGYESNLSAEQYIAIIKQPCHYCGAISSRKKVSKSKDLLPLDRITRVSSNSADRVNNEPFYDLNNTVPCCFVCQKMKGSLSMSAFVTQSQAVANYSLHKRLKK